MTTVKIIDVPASNANGYRWRWRSEDGRLASARDFDLFHDCLADAQAKGYRARFARLPDLPLRIAAPDAKPGQS